MQGLLQLMTSFIVKKYDTKEINKHAIQTFLNGNLGYNILIRNSFVLERNFLLHQNHPASENFFVNQNFYFIMYCYFNEVENSDMNHTIKVASE